MTLSHSKQGTQTLAGSASLSSVARTQQVLWHSEVVKAIELDETGRWVTVITETGFAHSACADELQGFDPKSIPQAQ